MEVTAHSDICGTIATLKRLLLRRNPRHRRVIGQLVRDIRAMLGKLDARQAEYEAFRKTVNKLYHRMEGINFVRNLPKEIGLIMACAESVDVNATFEAIKVVQKSAIFQEVKILRPYMALSVALLEAANEVKGARLWLLDAAMASNEIETKYQAWLPPGEHRTRLMGFFATGVAHVVADPELGEEPIVQFEDGGSIPMSRIRIGPRGYMIQAEEGS